MVNVLSPAVDATTPSLSSGSQVLMLPRHPIGQPNLLISDLLTPYAINVFRRFAAVNSTWIQVRVWSLRMRV